MSTDPMPVSVDRPALPTCAVVICAYTDERWDDILSAVRSAQAQQPPPDELILVVDHNPDLQARLADALPGVRVVPNHNKGGISGARNAGAELATTEVVVFLDDDAAAQPGWLAGLARNFNDPRVLGVGGLIEPAWERQPPGWWPDEFNWVVGCDYTGQRTGVVRNLIGANSSYRRKLFAKGGFNTGVGGRPDLLLARCEETEFCIRAGQDNPGGIFIHDRSAAVRHSVSAERETFQYFRTRCYAEGMSKAQVTEIVGIGSGLDSEWRYTLVALPKGVLRELWRAVRRDWNGLRTAAAIMIGFLYTTTGYVVGSFQRRMPRSRALPQ